MDVKRGKATATTPQIVVIVMDDSGSMKEAIPGHGTKADVASEGIKQLVMEMQATNLGSSASRYYLSLLKFGDAPTVIAEFEKPAAVRLSSISFTGQSGGTDMKKALI